MYSPPTKNNDDKTNRYVKSIFTCNISEIINLCIFFFPEYKLFQWVETTVVIFFASCTEQTNMSSDLFPTYYIAYTSQHVKKHEFTEPGTIFNTGTIC